MQKVSNLEILKAVRSLTTNINRIGRRINGLEKRFDSLESGFYNLEIRVGSIEKRFGAVLYDHTRKLESLEERTTLLPTMYTNIDKIIGEIQENRQERTFMFNTIKNHEIKIAKLEKN